MRNIVKFIPNAITLLNLLSGCFALLHAVNYDIENTVLWVLIGIIFDFFDGFLARLLNVQSELGKELDSLADVITSGLVPGIVMVQMLLKSLNHELIIKQFDNDQPPYIALFGFVITLASAYRLANFNIDKRQTVNFVGLPTPANALLILSLPLMHIYPEYQYISYVVENPYVLLLVTILSAYLLNANVELFSLKFKNFKFSDNKLKFSFLIASAILLVIFKIGAVPMIIVLYLVLSTINNRVYQN